MLDFSLSEEQQMVQDMAKDFAEKEVAPYVDQDEENHYYRRYLKNTAETAWAGWKLF